MSHVVNNVKCPVLVYILSILLAQCQWCVNIIFNITNNECHLYV